jgi:hypothetical protein
MPSDAQANDAVRQLGLPIPRRKVKATLHWVSAPHALDAEVRLYDHLFQVEMPMLFLQGTRDEFAQLELLTGVCEQLGERATLHLIEDGDHSFKVPKRSGRTAYQVMGELSDTIIGWAGTLTTTVS